MHVSRLNRLRRVLGRAFGLASLLVLGAGDALAQGAAGPELKPLTQYHLESWQTRDGLPTNGIRALAQDAEGFLWLGTEAGLVRFDGVEFRTFDRNSTPALKATDVTALFVDNVNRLWIGTDDGSVLRQRPDAVGRQAVTGLPAFEVVLRERLRHGAGRPLCEGRASRQDQERGESGGKPPDSTGSIQARRMHG